MIVGHNGNIGYMNLGVMSMKTNEKVFVFALIMFGISLIFFVDYAKENPSELSKRITSGYSCAKYGTNCKTNQP